MEAVLRREGGSSWPAKGKAPTRCGIWSIYNKALVQRGSIILWFNEEVLGQWLHTDPPSKRGHPFVYSQIAITCLLVVRELFRLPYRQLEGLARSLMQCLGLDLPVPDYTTLAKRAARLGAALKVRRRWPRIQGHGNCTGPPLARDVAIRGLRDMGRRRWKEPMGYHRRSLVETAASRLKGRLGIG